MTSGSEPLPPPPAGSRTGALPMAALALGALAMSASPVFVRTADVGPFASAFWRAFLALLPLALWAMIEARRWPRPRFFWVDRAVLLAGLFFAGDLFFWHLAVLNTTIANATLLATLAPVWVVAGSRVLIGERVAPRVFAGLGLCLLGGAALIGTSAAFEPDRLVGDLYGLVTSVFFGAYFLAVRAAARRLPPGRITFQSTAVTAGVLFLVAVALEDRLWPVSLAGFGSVIALALVSHAGGQGLVAFSLGRLPAAFSSLVIFLEALVAALLGWLVFQEAVSLAQAAGGALILAGIATARPRPRRAAGAVAADLAA